jgi:hypothetical protein
MNLKESRTPTGSRGLEDTHELSSLRKADTRPAAQTESHPLSLATDPLQLAADLL